MGEFRLSVALRMGKRGFEIRDSSKKNGLGLVVVIRLEHKLVPVVCAEAELQRPVEPVTIIAALDFEQRPFQELGPVVLRGFNQDVGRREEHMEGRPMSGIRGGSRLTYQSSPGLP